MSRGENHCFDCHRFISWETYGRNWRHIQNPSSFDPDAMDASFCDPCGAFRDKLQRGKE